MKAAALLVMACAVLAAADKEKDKGKSGGGKPNARFLGGLGGHQAFNFGGLGGESSFGIVGPGGHGHPHVGVGGFGAQNSFSIGGLGGYSSFGAGGLGGHPGFGPGGHEHGIGSYSSFGVGGPGLGGIGYPSYTAPPSTCRYWCRTPDRKAYCCEEDHEPPSLVGVVKPGYCPPVRPVCPHTRSLLPPSTCSNDGSCSGYDKCCFDTCLHEHVCKHPIGF